MTLIETADLCKRYGKVKALDGVDFGASAGIVRGLFGPNGAGKSTAIRVMTGITKPDSGEIKIAGIDVKRNPEEVRAICSIIVEIPMIYKYMTLYELLYFYGSLTMDGRSKIEQRIFEAAYLTGIGDILDKKFGKMSLGQQHRTEIARALLDQKDIILMDEPFIGIDIDTKKKLKDYFKNWVKEKEGRLIIFTSHNLLENEGFVDELSFIVEGKIKESGSVDFFKSKYLKAKFIIKVDEIKDALIAIQDIKNVHIDKFEGSNIHISLDKEEDIKKVNKELALKNIGILGSQRDGTMEDVFTRVVEVEE